MKTYYVYILTNKRNNVIYIGVTNDLVKRIHQHKNKYVKGFTCKYNVDKLIYYESYYDIRLAIEREKKLKNWHSEWKWNLVKSFNPNLKDLYFEIVN